MTTSNKQPIRITFYGAAQTVTGSRFLVEYEKERVLVDCGLFQGRKQLRLKNWEPPAFHPETLDAIVLTHAHIDHSGYLPAVVESGYRGPIYCTPATADLLELLLPDSAHLQEEEAEFANRHQTSRHHPAKPLYSEKSARRALSQLRTITRGRPFSLTDNITVTPSCAGHILGSTSLSVDVGGRRITFSGDVGRYDTPILADPEPLTLGNLLLCESTYGDRLHAKADTRAELAAVVNEAAHKNGALIIPAFAVGRTQRILYDLAALERAGTIPVLPVFVDSPMAVDATELYRKYKHDYDDEAQALLKMGESPLLTEQTLFCRTVDESKALNSFRGPRIIISASGMVNGGRILHHMIHHLPEEETTVLFVGYQAEGTRGRIIQAGANDIKIFGKRIPIRATIRSISGLSAHGDRDELLRWLRSCSGSPDLVRVIHGEESSSRVFAETLHREFSWSAQAAEYLETVEI
ncbi:MAG: MBL fold metallo-hydrolase [Bdellovibrionales bacterium]|nr:MBL fold metallo-hydrolase [Bdellovibrionales bacterium]